MPLHKEVLTARKEKNLKHVEASSHDFDRGHGRLLQAFSGHCEA